MWNIIVWYMKNIVILGMLALAFSSCAPVIITGQPGATSANAIKTIGLICTGTTYGTFTKAESSLNISISSDGKTTGSFINNNTLFSAEGITPVRDDGQKLNFGSLNLSLNSKVSGSASGQLGIRSGGMKAEYGSTGVLSGEIDSRGIFTGTFKGLQGTYRTVMSCKGA